MSRRRTTAQCPETGLSVFNKICKCIVCKAAKAENQKARRRAIPTMVKTNNLRKYGLTLDGWMKMYAAQGGVCDVCRQPERGQNQHGVMSLAVDHDHATGRVRALLCHRCNRALGLLGDNADRVQLLADYRRRFS